jgi:ethanolamine ammonia-lyase large subunit
VREVFGLKRAPEFEAWLERMRLTDAHGRLMPSTPAHPLLQGI